MDLLSVLANAFKIKNYSSNAEEAQRLALLRILADKVVAVLRTV